MHGRLAALLVLLALVPTKATSQEGQAPFLLVLKGQAAFVNYTPGALDRATHIQRRIELLAVEFSRKVKLPLRVRIFVLNRDEWAQFGFGVPYGIPGRIRGTTLAVPSLGDQGTVDLWTGILGVEVPPLPGIPMKGSAVEATTLAMADLLTEVEATRLLLSSAGLRGETPWVHQVLAHLVARIAFVRFEEVRMPEIDAFFEAIGPGTSKYPLERYSQGLDLETLLWFESRFSRGARVVFESARKKNELRKFLRSTLESGGLLTEEALLAKYPALTGWLEESFEAQPEAVSE
jgi:hypothetical protein